MVEAAPLATEAPAGSAVRVMAERRAARAESVARTTAARAALAARAVALPERAQAAPVRAVAPRLRAWAARPKAARPRPAVRAWPKAAPRAARTSRWNSMAAAGKVGLRWGRRRRTCAVTSLRRVRAEAIGASPSGAIACWWPVRRART